LWVGVVVGGVLKNSFFICGVVRKGGGGGGGSLGVSKQKWCQLK